MYYRYLTKILCFILILTNANVSFASSKKSWQRIQEIFIWKVSDQLDLNEKKEKELQDIVFTLSKQKRDASAEMSNLIEKIKQSSSVEEKGKLIVSYENALKKYNAANVYEINKLGKIFTTEQLAEYLVLKKELTEKLKMVLNQPRTDKKLRDPKIIKEQ